MISNFLVRIISLIFSSSGIFVHVLGISLSFSKIHKFIGGFTPRAPPRNWHFEEGWRVQKYFINWCDSPPPRNYWKNLPMTNLLFQAFLAPSYVHNICMLRLFHTGLLICTMYYMYCSREFAYIHQFHHNISFITPSYLIVSTSYFLVIDHNNF